MKQEGNTYVKRRRTRGQKRILMLVVAIIILGLSTNLKASRDAEPMLRGLDSKPESKEALVEGLGKENLSFEVFSYQAAKTPWVRLSCYGLNLEDGEWHYLRGSELRLEGEKGKLAVSFDGGRALWAAFFNEREDCFAEVNPDDRNAGTETTSTFWWRKGRTPITEGLEFAIVVQTIFTEDAPEGAEPIDPRAAHDPEPLKGRTDIRAAYALTLSFLPEEQDSFGVRDEESS